MISFIIQASFLLCCSIGLPIMILYWYHQIRYWRSGNDKSKQFLIEWWGA